MPASPARTKLADDPGLDVTPDADVKLAGYDVEPALAVRVRQRRALGRRRDAVRRASCRRSRSSTPASRRRADFGNGGGRERQPLDARRTPRPATAAATARSWRASRRARRRATRARCRRRTLVSVKVMNDQGMAKTSDVDRGLPVDPRQQGQVQHPASRTSRCTRATARASSSTRSTRRSRSSGSTAWSSSRLPATTAGRRPAERRLYAPGNDPFVITVGAIDLGTARLDADDDFVAPWSAYGLHARTASAKPDIAAPGRYMVGPVPAGSTLAVERREQRRRARLHPALGHLVRGSGRRRRGGADPGPAPELDAGPGQGRADASRPGRPNDAPRSVGVGEITDGQAAVRRARPPNPNLGLDRFLATERWPAARSFDAVSWSTRPRPTCPGTRSPGRQQLEPGRLDLAAWRRLLELGLLGDVSWGDVSGATSPGATFLERRDTYEDAAEGDANEADGYSLTPDQLDVLLADPDLAPPPDDAAGRSPVETDGG